MKFNKETPSDSFQPITVSFTVESKDEFSTILELLKWNESIPSVGNVQKYDDKWSIRKRFVDGIRTALES